MRAVVVAGGEGRRMREFEPEAPKPLIEVGGRSILEHQIRLLRRYDVADVHLTVRACDEAAFRERIGTGERFDVRLHYHAESEPLGTAGGVRSLLDSPGEDLLVFYGDVMVNMDLEALVRFHRVCRAAATLVVHPTDHPLDSDLVELEPDGRIRAVRPKPRAAGEEYRNCGNAALYVFAKEAASFISNGPNDFIRDVFPRALEAGAALFGYRTREYLKDTGTPERLERVRADFASGRIERFHREHAVPAVFFDRDGTLCELVPLLCRVEDLRLLPGVAEAVRRVNEAGMLSVVATNQPMVAHGLCSIEDVERIHARMETLIGAEGAKFDGIYFCPHHPDTGYEREVPELKIACECRKPGGGLFRQAARDLNIDLARSYLIGDATRDIEAGRRLGLRTIGVETGKACRDGKFPALPDVRCADVPAAVRHVLHALR